MRCFVLASVALTAACSGGSPAVQADAAETYARIVLASYEDSVSTAEDLDAAVQALVDDPSEATLTAARNAWLASREPYLQTEVFRFYDGPIDNPDNGPEGLLNAWPLDENYIDYVEGDEDAGIIQDDSVTIDAQTLESLNEKGGEANIATGYHAVEFLLWGQDRSATGPGDRPFTDYVAGGTGTAANADRRATYLTTVSGLIVTHLTGLADAWAEGASYRVDWEADGEVAFEKALTGMIVLSGFETGGERLQAALDSGEQEDEHSCFSDNTHRDMIQDVRGIQNVWLGSYGSIDSVGLYDVVAAEDTGLADRITDQIATSLSLANDLQVPFDQEIVPGAPGNTRVQALIDSLRDQEDLLSQVFVDFGLSIPQPE